nr:tyrosine-type recombinase/integrase [Aquibacillus saliphilus]
MEDGKYLSFKKEKDDFLFLSFFVYGNKYRKKKLSDGTEKLYLRDLKHFNKFLYNLESPTSLSDVGIVQLDAYEKEINKEFSSSTAHRKLKMIRSLLRFGFKVEFYERDMTHYIQLPQIQNTKQERKLNRKEVQLLLDEMKQKQLNRVIGSLLIMMGLRVSELCNATWNDIYEGTSGQTMIRVFGKGEKPRRLKLKPDIFGLILQYRAANNLSIIIGSQVDEPLIVNSKGKSLNDRVVRYMINRAAKRAGINKNVSPHWFRHSAITFALDDGAGIDEVRRMAGHSDIRTTQQYLHDLEEEKEKSASEYISGINI